MSQDVTTWSLTTTLQNMRAGKISTVEYLADLLAYSKLHRSLEAYITNTGEQAFAAAQTPHKRDATLLLQGIPFAVKDNIDVAGIPTTAGTPRLKQHIPTINSGIWQNLASQGALLFGKASMHELAYGVTGQCTGSPTALNPCNNHHLAGGSSSGTASAVAAGFVPVGLGTDTGGSVRIPAAVCGIFGFRPTTGRYPNDGIVLISPTRDTAGIMARNIEDILLLDGIITGKNHSVPTVKTTPQLIKFALPKHAWENIDTEVEHILLNCLYLLQKAGYTVIHTNADIYGGLTDELLSVATTIPAAETLDAIANYLKETHSTATVEDVIQNIASQDVRNVLLPLIDTPIPHHIYHEALTKQKNLRELANKVHRKLDVDAVITPTTITTAAPVDINNYININGTDIPTFQAYIRNTASAPVLGRPSITIPVGKTSKGLPVGLMLDGFPNDDVPLLQIALQCSRLFQYI